MIGLIRRYVEALERMAEAQERTSVAMHNRTEHEIALSRLREERTKKEMAVLDATVEEIGKRVALLEMRRAALLPSDTKGSP